jgi:hypothetical protein
MTRSLCFAFYTCTVITLGFFDQGTKLAAEIKMERRLADHCVPVELSIARPLSDDRERSRAVHG